MGKEKESFIFYRSWLEAIDEASEIEQAHIYSAIAHYALNLKNPTKLKGIEKIVFLLAKPQIDANHRRYLNGQKGGAPKNNLNATKKQPRNNRDTTEKQPNDNVNDNVNVNDNEPTNVGNKDKEKSTNVDKKKLPLNNRFKKPTINEVEAYCKERGNYVNAEAFCDFYESKGWKVGNSPMKDWKSAVRTWEKRDGRARKPMAKDIKLGVGEWIDEQGNRRYGTGTLPPVPMDAPPRMSEDSYWSAETNSWITGC